MSTMVSHDPYSEYERSYSVDMLQTQMFGAIFSVYQHRKDSVGLSNVEMANRAGWTRSQVSKAFANPQNFTLRTVSEIATMLDVDLVFMFIDKKDMSRRFTANGMTVEYHAQSVQQKTGIHEFSNPSNKGVFNEIRYLNIDYRHINRIKQSDPQTMSIVPEIVMV